MTLKRLVNISFLSLSISLSGYFLYFFSKNPAIQIMTSVFAVMYELGNRYILAAGRTAWKNRRIFSALILFVFYGTYICYNVLSGAGFFITEISEQDRAVAQAEIVQTANLQKLDQLYRTIETLNRALEVEVETTFRSRSAAIEAKIKEREAERDAILETMAISSAEKVQEKNPFRDLSAVLGVPMNRLVGVVWCMVMAGICVILIVTSEDLPEEKEPRPTKSGNDTKRRVALQRNTKAVTETAATAEATTCACGCGKTFPATPGRLYYNTACRVRESRRRKREEELKRIKREGVKVF